MLDLLYLIGTVAFFALMFGYVVFCDRLERPPEAARDDAEKRP